MTTMASGPNDVSPMANPAMDAPLPAYWHADRLIITDLMAAAHLPGAWRAFPLLGRGELNRHWVVQPSDGLPVIARVYGWPFPDPEPFDRCAKENWLLELLSQAGAAVPRRLAMVRSAAGAALLVERLGGAPLG